MYNDLILQLQLAESQLEDVLEQMEDDSYVSGVAVELVHTSFEVSKAIKKLQSKQQDLELEAQGLVS